MVSRAEVAQAEVRIASFADRWALRTRQLAPPCEVTLHLPRAKGETQPPSWALPLMGQLIERARADRLRAGQIVRWPKPFGEGVETDLEAFALTIEPSFGVIDDLPVLLAVGLTRDEAKLVREWSPQGLLEVLLKQPTALQTAVDRASLLSSPRARQAIEQRVEREGSSMGVLEAALSTVTRGSWRIDVETADACSSLLKGRIGHQRPFVVRSQTHEVEIAPGEAPAFSTEGTRSTLKVTQTFARAMRSTLRAAVGTYSWEALPGLTIEVVSP